MREKRANEYLNHIVQQLDVKSMLNDGFRDGAILAEESYMCDIVQGEPSVEKVNPFELQVYMSGYSNRIEDAEVVTITKYLPIGKIYDMYFSDKDFSKVSKRLEKDIKDFTGQGVTDMGENDYTPAYRMYSQVFDDVPEGFDPFVPFGEQMDIT